MKHLDQRIIRNAIVGTALAGMALAVSLWSDVGGLRALFAGTGAPVLAAVLSCVTFAMIAFAAVSAVPAFLARMAPAPVAVPIPVRVDQVKKRRRR